MDCSVQLPCTSEDLRQDLNILKRLLDTMQYHTLVSDVAHLVKDFTHTYKVFSDDITTVESEVKAVISNKRENEYNNVKDRIKE